MRGNEVLNIDSTNQVRVENELKSKLYAPMTEEEMLARIEKIQRTGNLQGCGSCDFKYEVKVWIVRSISMSQMDKVYIV